METLVAPDTSYGMASDQQKYHETPDCRYFVVRGRPWRKSNPAIHDDARAALVAELMDARRRVGDAKRREQKAEEKSARAAVHRVKCALGERGPVWWTDGAPD